VDLVRILDMARRVEQRLHCSHQRAEYIASILAWDARFSKDSFELLAEVRAVHSSRKHATVSSNR
jgi:hypothetical protein